MTKKQNLLPSELYITEAQKSKEQTEKEILISDPDSSAELLEKLLRESNTGTVTDNR